MKGSVYKRCACPVVRNAKGERLACKLKHGSWTYVAEAGRDPKTGHRRQVRGSGFPTKTEAEAALAELADSVNKGTTAHDGRQTFKTYLEGWISEKERNGMRPTTVRGYRAHIDHLIVPMLGHLRLRDVRPTHIEAVLREAAKPKEKGRAMGPVSIRRLHATMRSALATAKTQRLISFNPAVDVELPATKRFRVHPWEPAELGKFLDHAAADPFGPLFELIAGTGLRRGEAVGLRWDDVDLQARRLIVRQQLVAVTTAAPCQFCHGVHRGAAFGPPKTASGEARVVELDGGVVGVLLAHRLQQDLERSEWAEAYSDHGLVFAREDGTPIAPERVTKRFVQLTTDAGLRQIRLHDLRHGQASLMLAAGIEMSVISKRLGHSTIALTNDTYSHLLEGVGRDAAERAAALVPRASRQTLGDQSVTTSPSETTEGPQQNAERPRIVALPTGLEPVTVRLTVEADASRDVTDDR